MTDLRGWNVCPCCAGAVELDRERARCAACGYEAYANPAPAMCAFVLDGAGRVLLGRRAREPEAGKWDVLGGFAQEDEHGLEALRRELREETGCDVEPLAFVGAFADRYGATGGATLNLFWTARIVSGEPRPADDVAELRWFSRAELPPDDELAFRNVRLAVAALQAHESRVEAPAPGMFEVQLAVSDLAAMTAFYGDLVGLTVSLHDDQRGRTHFRLSPGQLILARADGEDGAPTWPGLPPPLLAAADTRGPTPPPHGPVHFALEIGLTAVLDCEHRLRAEGHDVRGPFRWPSGRLSIYVRDPEGNVSELISRRNAAPPGP
jgi:ADP-ribose pyrophosphatase YjhB (NUDIX family)/catechol 2,3-dioxygenase-like lactoylglutathione lyase family enzyme